MERFSVDVREGMGGEVAWFRAWSCFWKPARWANALVDG